MLKRFPHLLVNLLAACLDKCLPKREYFPAAWLSFAGQYQSQICLGWDWGLKIYVPARTPGLNPVESIFHIVKQRLHQNALAWQITWDFAASSARVKTAMEFAPIDVGGQKFPVHGQENQQNYQAKSSSSTEAGS